MRTVGNVVKSIPFVDANRDDHVRLHPSDSRIPIAPILNRKISSPLISAWGNFCSQEKTRKTQRHKNTRHMGKQYMRQTFVSTEKYQLFHHPPGSNCLVCLLPHAVTLSCCRFFGSLANSSRAAGYFEVFVSGFTRRLLEVN